MQYREALDGRFADLKANDDAGMLAQQGRSALRWVESFSKEKKAEQAEKYLKDLQKVVSTLQVWHSFWICANHPLGDAFCEIIGGNHLPQGRCAADANSDKLRDEHGYFGQHGKRPLPIPVAHARWL
jgi:hypothetical protein